MWSQILGNIALLDIDAIATILSQSQTTIEQACGGRNIGKAIMPWSAFAHFYDQQDGLGDNGKTIFKLAEAFEKSFCSLEVKSGAREAAKVYGAKDYA